MFLHTPCISPQVCSEGGESRSPLSLETKGIETLGIVKKDTETLGLISVLPEVLSQVKSRSRLVNKKMRHSCLGLVSYKKLALTISRSQSCNKFL